MLVFKGNESYDGNDIRLSFFSDNPFRGTLSDTIYGNNVNELKKNTVGCTTGNHFYVLYSTVDGEKIGSGIIDFDSIEKDPQYSVASAPRTHRSCLWTRSGTRPPSVLGRSCHRSPRHRPVFCSAQTLAPAAAPSSRRHPAPSGSAAPESPFSAGPAPPESSSHTDTPPHRRSVPAAHIHTPAVL